MSPRRILHAVLVAALPWVAALAPSPAAAQTTPKPPALGVAVTTCETGLLDSDRVAVFTASMPAIPKGVSMAMRFDLEERLGSTGRFAALPAPNFGRWERSEPNVAGFVYTKRVQGLQAPAGYRVKVRFRWLDADGVAVRATRRVSAVCEQPDERPDLEVSRLRVGTGTGGVGLYSVTVRNDGLSDVLSSFVIGLSVGGVPQQSQEVGALATGAAVTFVFRAPRCAEGTAVVARVDAGRTVDEADERDNTLRTTCPAV
jgi:hypothetical protein